MANACPLRHSKFRAIKLKKLTVRNGISSIAIPRSTSANNKTDWTEIKNALFEEFNGTNLTLWVSKDRNPRPKPHKPSKVSSWDALPYFVKDKENVAKKIRMSEDCVLNPGEKKTVKVEPQPPGNDKKVMVPNKGWLVRNNLW